MKIGCILFKYDYGKQANGLSLEYRFTEIFKELGHTVCPLWIDDLVRDPARLGEVIQMFGNGKYDMIFFIPMGNEIPLKILDSLSHTHKTVAWFGDDTWRFDRYSKHLAPHFKYIITTDKYSVDKYKALGRKVVLSQWGSVDKAEIGDVVYQYDVSFVGRNSAYRNWVRKYLKGYNIKFCHGVSGYRMKQIIKTSKINLSLSNSVCFDLRCILSSVKGLREVVRRRKTAEQIKARNFEIPALGGFQISNYVRGLEDHFKIGEEIVVYSTIESLRAEIDYYLRNEDQRQAILLAGHQRAANCHLYKHRIMSFLKEVGK